MATRVLSDADNEKIEKLEKEIEQLNVEEALTRKLPYNQERTYKLDNLSNIIINKKSTINNIKGIIQGEPPVYDIGKYGGYRKISRKSTKSARRSSKGARRSSKGTRRSIACKSAKRAQKRKSLRRR